ncbi:hypothetical protein [Roseibium sp. RKSG952]|uniref:hypothetical protein n=1 Tax=Roseibium sp. RKSG952 TaxID=2529384 RepID=UPI0012BCAE4A|nr:hypothetical protein [Roseibium sp. RKSG952]MTH94977.1 hypothetical protein [Roseibium sp. RKSG952]
MNLRTLKKLSKRAVPLLHQIGEKRTIFPAEKDENYHGLIIRDMTRLERYGASHADVINPQLHVATITPKCRQGTSQPYVKCYLSQHPIKGTPMVGEVSGYYEPEWSEETAYEALLGWVRWNFFEYDPKTEDGRFTRSFKHSSDVFRAATELLSQNQPNVTK